MGRPLGVAVLAIIASLIGLVEILRAFLTFGSPLADFLFSFHFPGAFAFPFYLIMGLIWLFIGYSFWEGVEIGLVLGIIMATLIAVIDYPVGTIFGGVVLLYLIVPKGVRNWFSKPGIKKWMEA
ncbi:MAG: hypothetical protein M1161_01110 [Candidatus Thermoplasmatota archaeon]|jgi:hypothetical protein|nr:hypothetical protein [Candidatus Thermoplasmatota archaeon]